MMSQNIQEVEEVTQHTRGQGSRDGFAT